MKKRILSVFLALCMIVSLVPCVASAATSGKNIQIGDYLQMGTYYGEPILWRCVAFDKISGYDSVGNPIIDPTDTVTEYEEGYLPLMLADKIICLKAYDVGNSLYSSSYRKSCGSNFWDTSCLSQWLNSDGVMAWKYSAPSSSLTSYNHYENENGFMNGFSSMELSVIQQISQKTYLNSLDSGYAVEGSSKYQPRESSVSTVFSNLSSDISNKWCMYTTNKIFIMDSVQAKNVYDNLGNEYLFAYPTQSAITNSSYSNSSLSNSKYYTYWLRCPMNTGMSYENVYALSSSVFTNGKANNGTYGVRPAFYLNLSSLKFESGSGDENNPYIIDSNSTSSGSVAVHKTDTDNIADNVEADLNSMLSKFILCDTTVYGPSVPIFGRDFYPLKFDAKAVLDLTGLSKSITIDEDKKTVHVILGKTNKEGRHLLFKLQRCVMPHGVNNITKSKICIRR